LVTIHELKAETFETEVVSVEEIDEKKSLQKDQWRPPVAERAAE
jgi:hypothetical protein